MQDLKITHPKTKIAPLKQDGLKKTISFWQRWHFRGIKNMLSFGWFYIKVTVSVSHPVGVSKSEGQNLASKRERGYIPLKIDGTPWYQGTWHRKNIDVPKKWSNKNVTYSSGGVSKIKFKYVPIENGQKLAESNVNTTMFLFRWAHPSLPNTDNTDDDNDNNNKNAQSAKPALAKSLTIWRQCEQRRK